jgi:hypothetical protein
MWSTLCWMFSLFYATELHVTWSNGLSLALTCFHAVDKAFLQSVVTYIGCALVGEVSCQLLTAEAEIYTHYKSLLQHYVFSVCYVFTSRGLVVASNNAIKALGCWPSPAQLFLVLSPAGLMTIFYCLMTLGVMQLFTHAASPVNCCWSSPAQSFVPRPFMCLATHRSVGWVNCC